VSVAVAAVDHSRRQPSSLPVHGGREHAGGTCVPGGCRQRRRGPARTRP